MARAFNPYTEKSFTRSAQGRKCSARNNVSQTFHRGVHTMPRSMSDLMIKNTAASECKTTLYYGSALKLKRDDIEHPPVKEQPDIEVATGLRKVSDLQMKKRRRFIPMSTARKDQRILELLTYCRIDLIRGKHCVAIHQELGEYVVFSRHATRAAARRMMRKYAQHWLDLEIAYAKEEFAASFVRLIQNKARRS